MRTTLCFAILSIVVFPTTSKADDSSKSPFEPVYQILKNQCGQCHHTGGASSWVVDLPPAADQYTACLEPADEAARHQCTTYRQLVEVPGPDIPAWIRPHEAAKSEPYVNACDAEASFHIGVSLPEKLPDSQCKTILEWIVSGANP